MPFFPGKEDCIEWCFYITQGSRWGQVTFQPGSPFYKSKSSGWVSRAHREEMCQIRASPGTRCISHSPRADSRVLIQCPWDQPQHPPTPLLAPKQALLQIWEYSPLKLMNLPNLLGSSQQPQKQWGMEARGGMKKHCRLSLESSHLSDGLFSPSEWRRQWIRRTITLYNKILLFVNSMTVHILFLLIPESQLTSVKFATTQRGKNSPCWCGITSNDQLKRKRKNSLKSSLVIWQYIAYSQIPL